MYIRKDEHVDINTNLFRPLLCVKTDKQPDNVIYKFVKCMFVKVDVSLEEKYVIAVNMLIAVSPLRYRSCNPMV